MAKRKFKINRNGLAIIALTLITLVVLVGIRLYENSQTTSLTNRTTTLQDTKTPSPTPNLEIQSCQENECIIKELGIKFKTPSELNDLVYIANKNYAVFSTKSLITKSDACKPPEDPLGVLVKAKKSDLSESNTNWRDNESKLKKYSKPWINPSSNTLEQPISKEFDEFYIYYDAPQSYCSPSKNEIDLQDKQFKIFKKVVQDIEITE